MDAQDSEKPLVLVVDDDMAGLLMASEALASDGFSVIEAEDGQEAIDQFLAHKPDVVIMDVVMPRMDGFESCAKIRQCEGGQHVPILMVTGLEDVDSIQKAYEVGATDFVTKPINFFLLPYRVTYMMRAKKTADALRESQVRLDNAQRIAKLGHWEWVFEDNTFNWSSECTRLLNLANQNKHLHSFLNCVHIDDRYSVSNAMDRAKSDSGQFTLEFRTAANTEEDTRIMHVEAECASAGNMLGTIQDITERTKAEDQIHRLAYYDLVTGLPNRAQLHDMISLALTQSRQSNSRFALLFLDLDHFKQVNDTLGHNAGDTLLRNVSTRLKEAVRWTDGVNRNTSLSNTMKETIARLGGDEFVVLLNSIDRIEDAAVAADRICKALSNSFTIEETEVRVTTTIGISVYPSDGESVDQLLKHADVAMYHAKEQGRNGYQFYSQSIHNLALERFSLERDLRKALETDGFHLEYQPKVALKDTALTGVEALVRWNHPQRGRVSPADFIPLAEETGLIVPLGEWVLRSACVQMMKWLSAGIPPFIMAVNCSAIQLVRTDMAKVITSALEVTGLNPAYLEIELTESLLMQDVEEGIAILQALKDLGVHVSIDDFGTGFSSLSYLKRLPVDKLKIDQSFIKDLTSDPGDAAIVTSMITLAHNLDLTVVAEGVETEQQLGYLRAERCDEIQGYLISRPLEPDAFTKWVDERNSTLSKAA
jgi:diguanylate cyclase (GGDEF)-like protein